MIRVRVPATSANIGPGFDTLGIAFDLYNEYEFSFIETGVEFEGVEKEFTNENNIILISMKKTFNKFKYRYKGIKIKILKQDIPVSRGLGSSSSCIVAGIMGAYSLMKRDINKEEIFQLATEIEGHPDNVGPAIFGGMVVSVMEKDKPIYNSIDVKDGIRFIALIPNFEVSTKKARAALPDKVSFNDAVFNVGRVSLLISCFCNGNYKLLKTATNDKLHEPYRSDLIYGYYEINNLVHKLGGLSCFVSGAGPTLMAIIEDMNNNFVEEMNKSIKDTKAKWKVQSLTIDKVGAMVIEGD